MQFQLGSKCGLIQISISQKLFQRYQSFCYCQGPLAKHVQLRVVVHVPGIPGTLPPPPRVSDPDKHHGTRMTHVPWCMPGSLTSGVLWNRWRGNVPSIPGACATRNFTYLARGPFNGGKRCSLLTFCTCSSMQTDRPNLDDVSSTSTPFEASVPEYFASPRPHLHSKPFVCSASIGNRCGSRGFRLSSDMKINILVANIIRSSDETKCRYDIPCKGTKISIHVCVNRLNEKKFNATFKQNSNTLRRLFHEWYCNRLFNTCHGT